MGEDGLFWRRLLEPLVDNIDAVGEISSDTLLRRPQHLRTALQMMGRVLLGGGWGWNIPFREDVAPALLTGVEAHAGGRLPSLAASAIGLVLAAHGHGRGWPVAAGGSQAIADSLLADLVNYGGKVCVATRLESLGEVAGSRAILLDVGVPGLLAIAGDRLPARYVRALERYRYGPGTCKIDYALSSPVPWATPEVTKAGTVHIGGTRAETAAAERAVLKGMHPDAPFVIVGQPTVLDPSRAPAGKHVRATTHVPQGSAEDMSEAVTRQIERFAPGFRETILEHHTTRAMDLAAMNPNLVGGNITSGEISVTQMVRRPILSTAPWRTPLPGVYLCSAATPPGASVHGMGGFHAMRLALRDVFGIDQMPPLKQ